MDQSAVFHRRLDRRLPRAVKAQGVWVEDADGKRYLDASGGPICINVGHGRREVVRAMMEQAGKVDYVHGTMFTTEPLELLAQKLSRHAPEGIDRFYFISSGSEAMETAVKLARQIHLSRGEASRYRIAARWHSYHGATLGALSVGGKPGMRNPFIPMLLPTIHIPPPYCLRCPYDTAYPSCSLRCAHALDEAIRQEGAHTIAAFVAETVCGATLGAVVPPPEYYSVIRDICSHHGVLMILDEVMCGMGRTGRWLALEHYSVAPDMIVLGKGLGGGYAAVSAVGCKSADVDRLRERGSGFTHGHTYSHHAVSTAAALAVVNILENEALVERAARQGETLKRLLAPLLDHPHVGDVRGIGLMWGIELVRNKKTLSPYPRSEKAMERVFDALMRRGIITYECIGFVGGDGEAIMLGPPFIIEDDQLAFLVGELTGAINEVLGPA